MNNRSLAWLKVFGIAFSILASIWIGFYYLFTDIGHAAALERKYRDELTKRGFFETEQQFRDSFKVPPDEDAAPLVEPILTKFSKQLGYKPKDKDVIAYVQANSGLIHQLAALPARRYCAFSNRFEGGGIVFNDSSNLAKRLSKTLSRAGVIRYKESDRKEALLFWRLTAQLGRYVEDGGFWGDLEYRTSITKSLVDDISTSVSFHTLKPSEATEILDLLRPLDSPLPVMKVIKRGHWLTLRDSELHLTTGWNQPCMGDVILPIMRKVPGIGKAVRGRIHEGFYQFAEVYEEAEIHTIQEAFDKLQLAADRESPSSAVISLNWRFASGLGKLLVEDHDRRQHLFAKLERIAGIKKQRFDSKGNKV